MGDVILEVMQNTLQYTTLQRQLVWALTNLCYHAHNAIRFDTLGGINIVLKAKALHARDPDLQEEYSKLLKKLHLGEEDKEMLQDQDELQANPEAMTLRRDVEL